MSYLLGRSGQSYSIGHEQADDIERIRKDHDSLIVRYGGLRQAVITIAAMLDCLPELEEPKGSEPRTACEAAVILLLQASEALS